MTLLQQVKLLKGIKDNLQDDLIELIIQDSEERILSRLNYNREDEITTVPDDLTYIVRDVAIKRFNKLNSEGATSDKEEGRSFDWEKNYLAEYEVILDSYSDKRAGKGAFRFV